MPKYVYLCEECGPFEEWINMREVTEFFYCPTCKIPAARLYTPPGLITSSPALRHRIEQSAIPKVVNRKNHGQHQSRHHHTSSCELGQRPWQVGH